MEVYAIILYKVALLKLHTKTRVSKLIHFQDEKVYLFYLQNKAIRSESLLLYYSVFPFCVVKNMC